MVEGSVLKVADEKVNRVKTMSLTIPKQVRGIRTLYMYSFEFRRALVATTSRHELCEPAGCFDASHLMLEASCPGHAAF